MQRGPAAGEDAGAGREQAREFRQLMREIRIILGIDDAQGDGGGFIAQGGAGDFMRGQVEPR